MPRVLVDPGESVQFRCPGCGWLHLLNINPATRPCWGFNGNADMPTLTPSINAWREYSGDRRTERCHSFVENGRIRFLGDCTHEHRGKTLELPELVSPEELGGAQ